MPKLIERPTVVAAAGSKPKRIEEYAGHVNSGHANVSVARMVSPGGWVEPGQRPEDAAGEREQAERHDHAGGVADTDEVVLASRLRESNLRTRPG